jgi:signal transduction histidine kinase
MAAGGPGGQGEGDEMIGAVAAPPEGRLRGVVGRVRRAVHAVARVPTAAVVRALRDVPAAVADGALAAVFLAVMLVQLTRSSLPEAQLPLAAALSVVMAGGLALRRRMPLGAYLTGSLALLAEARWAATSPVSPYANLIGAYSLGLYATRGRARLGLLFMIPGVLAYFSVAGSSAGGPAVGVLFGWLLAWAAGYGGARRREEQAVARQAIRAQAVAEERLRLARELHDLVGHTVNLMVVQAGAGRRVLDRDPAKTREILTSLEHVGRDALTELDRVLGVLRSDGVPAASSTGGGDAAASKPGRALGGEGLTVPPGIADLPRLARQMDEAGIRVTIRIDPPAPQVASSVDLSAYRIIQEALTNALKHGGARSASVTVRYDGRAVHIEVHDDGRGAPAGYHPGRGLLGITERVSAFGGSVEYGGGAHGGFRLQAVLPVS